MFAIASSQLATSSSKSRPALNDQLNISFAARLDRVLNFRAKMRGENFSFHSRDSRMEIVFEIIGLFFVDLELFRGRNNEEQQEDYSLSMREAKVVCVCVWSFTSGRLKFILEERSSLRCNSDTPGVKSQLKRLTIVIFS